MNDPSRSDGIGWFEFGLAVLVGLVALEKLASGQLLQTLHLVFPSLSG
jgi:hypothetical protein